MFPKGFILTLQLFSAPMMQIRIGFFCLFCLLGLRALQAELNLDPRGDRSLNNWSRYAAVRLEIERTRFAAGEDIPVRIKVKNTAYQTIRIYPYVKANQTFQFFLSDRQGREIPQEFDPAAWERREKGSEIISLQRQRIKEIILGPEESFEKVLYLNDFYDLRPNQDYRLWLYFYPFSSGQSNLFVRSENLLHFRIDQRRYQKRKEHYPFPKKQRALHLSPEETVYLFLSAEVQKNWPHYLKYLDLKKYVAAYSNYASRYIEAEPQERELVLEEFSTFLTSEPAAPLKSFRLLDARPEHGTAGGGGLDGGGGEGERYFVRVMGLRQAGTFSSRYEYRYTLESQPQAKGFWKIIHVQTKLIR